MRIGRPALDAARALLGRTIQAAGVASAAVWLVLGIVWSDHGEGAGYATPVAVLAAAASVSIGWAARRLLTR